jgi:hypothetical protein
LRQSFGCYSYSDEPVYRQSEFVRNPDLIGHIELARPWADFYRKATEAPEIFLVKTHNPPRDRQPFIYVVRDGRAAIQSYQKFHRDYNHTIKSLVSLILGDDLYGDWSGHYRQWNERGVDGLVLRFDELIRISSESLEKIAQYVHFDGDYRDWRNPVEELKSFEPDFFNQGDTGFTPGPNWTDAVAYLFFKNHGPVMQKLGFCRQPPDKVGAPELEKLVDELNVFTSELLKEKYDLNAACREKEILINRLSAVCEERLQLINQLHEQINRNGGE